MKPDLKIAGMIPIETGLIPFYCRDDKIRTCDPTPPRRVRYRAALHPEKTGWQN